MSELSVVQNEYILSLSDLLPSQTGYNGSITEHLTFRVLYDNSACRQHFKATRQPLPLEMVMTNASFMKILQDLEHGSKFDYNAICSKLARIKFNFGQLRETLFMQVDVLLTRRQVYMQTASCFIVYDLYVNMLKQYYRPSGDIALRNLFPESLEIYLAEASAYANPARIASLESQWSAFQNAALEAATSFLTLKDLGPTRAALHHLNHAFTIANRQDMERNRSRQAQKRRTERARNANLTALNRLACQDGKTELPPTVVDRIVKWAGERNQIHVDQWATEENLQLELMKLGIDKHPDSWHGPSSSSSTAGNGSMGV